MEIETPQPAVDRVGAYSIELFGQSVRTAMLGAARFAFMGAAPAIAGTIEIRDAIAEREEAMGDDIDEVDVFMKITNTGDAADRLYAVRWRDAGLAFESTAECDPARATLRCALRCGVGL